MDENRYSSAMQIRSVVGVESAAFVTCLRCGAAILLDKRDAVSPVDIHNAWHDQERAR